MAYKVNKPRKMIIIIVGELAIKFSLLLVKTNKFCGHEEGMEIRDLSGSAVWKSSGVSNWLGH